MDDELLKIHGPDKCHIFGKPYAGAGKIHCSYPHGLLPKEQVYGVWTWEPPVRTPGT